MSLETAIQENTKALCSLAEIIKQALSLQPAPVAPVAAPEPVKAAPTAEAKPAPQPEPKPEPAPVAKVAPAPTPAPAPEPAPEPVDFAALRKTMVGKLQKLFEASPTTGAEVLKSFDIRRQSELPDEKLVAFTAALDKALAEA